MAEPFIDDPDFQLHVGDALETLQAMPAESVHCCVTSPPYWGLRDYGTGTWEGGEADCDHVEKHTSLSSGERYERYTTGGAFERGGDALLYQKSCGKCGATRVDQQLGLEPTPGQYVTNMVEVFRQVRRVLRADGTLWLNIGDSYAGGGYSNHENTGGAQREDGGKQAHTRSSALGLKPKDLVGIPWRLAFALQQPYYTGTIKYERDRIWLAAMVEAEGCMFIHRRKAGQSNGQGYERKNDSFGAGLEVASTDRVIVERCLAIAGKGSIGVVERGSDSRRRQTLYRWMLRSNECRDIIRELYPHMVAKQHEARLLLSCPSSGSSAIEAWQSLKSIHQGRAPTIDFKPPETLFEPGWYVRSDIVWSKANPMPESVTDRPTKAHEYLFLLSKSPRYFYDADAIREPAEWARWGDQTNGKHEGSESAAGWIGSKTYEELKGSRRGTDAYQSGGIETGATWAGSTPGVMHPSGRNKRSVWEIATAPYPEAHFATFPPALVEPCIKAGSSERVCADCGRPITLLEWEHGSSTTDLRRVSDDLHQPESEVLLEDLREQSHSAESSVDARVHNGEGIQATSGARPSNGESRGVRDGASPSDGEGAGSDAVEGRGRASQERDQGRQPRIESRSDAKASTRSQTQTAEEADHLSALRRRDHHIWSCPACGCGETTAGVILDCFLGSGTTAQVARRLGRRSIGIELNPEYAQLAARRLQQLSLFATETAEA